MFKSANSLFMICESSMHAGTGDNLGIVDLPIQREKHTDYPKVESSSLKGSIRSAFEHNISNDKIEDKRNVHRLFGYDDAEKDPKVKKSFEDQTDFAAAIGFSDARLLLFPVKSMKGVFAWITCPSVLNKFFCDMKLTGFDVDLDLDQVKKSANTTPENSALMIDNNCIVLEEYSISVHPHPFTDALANWLANNIIPVGDEYNYTKEQIKSNLVIVDNNRFTNFVKMSTEVVTRTKIDNETGTVEQGALFTEELLPQDSILYSLLLYSPIMGANKGEFTGNSSEITQKVAEYFKDKMPERLQIGGDATLGRGLVSTKIIK